VEKKTRGGRKGAWMNLSDPIVSLIISWYDELERERENECSVLNPSIESVSLALGKDLECLV
jgi:hypothetical protein